MAVILVLSTKGGAGKSSVSQQVLATYNLKNAGESELAELDDENLDSAYLNKSGINAQQITLGDDPDEYAMAVASAFPLDAKNRVVDVGGNRTASIVIKELSRLTSRSQIVDAVAIPVADNRMGVQNAEKTLKEIQNSTNGDLLLAKCFIVLNRVRNKKVNSIDDPALARRFRNAINMIKRWKLPAVIVHDLDGVENLAPLGKTVYEVAGIRKQLISALNTQMKEAAAAQDEKEMVLVDDLQWAVNVAADDFMPLIERSHAQLAEVLEVIKFRVAEVEDGQSTETETV